MQTLLQNQNNVDDMLLKWLHLGQNYITVNGIIIEN